MTKPRARFTKVETNFFVEGWYGVQEEQPSTSQIEERPAPIEEPIDRTVPGFGYKTPRGFASKAFEKEEQYKRSQRRLNEDPILVDLKKVREAKLPERSLKCPKWFEENEEVLSVEEFRRNVIRCFRMEETPNRLGPSSDMMRRIHKKYVSYAENKMARCINAGNDLDEKSVIVPLGPTACLFVNTNSIDQHYMECLSKTDVNFACMRIEKGSETRSKKAAEQFLRESGAIAAKETTFNFSFPGVPYSMEMKYGEKVEAVSNENNSRFALVVENVPKESRPSQHFSYKFGQCVKAKKMSCLHAKELFRRTHGFDQADIKENGYLVEFENLESKRNARCQEELKDCVFAVDGTVDYSKTHNTVAMEIKYYAQDVLTEIGLILLRDPSERAFAKKVLSRHNIECFYFHPLKDYGKLDEFFHQCNNKLFIRGLPSWVDSNDTLKLFVDRILRANGVFTTGIEFVEKRCNENIRDRSEFHLTEQVFEVCLSAEWGNSNEMYRMKADHWQNSKLSRETNWNVKTLTKENKNSQEQKTAVRFLEQGYRIGMFAISQIVEGVNRRNDYFLSNKKKIYKPRIVPLIRKMLPVSKNVRISFDAKIQKFDEEIRNEVISSGIVVGNTTLKVIEYYRENESEGFIGIEGWNEQLVNSAVARLTELLKPICLDCVEEKLEELLYGIGEAYAKHVLMSRDHRQRVVADFDRFNGKIRIYGSNAEMVVEEMRSYISKKPTLVINTRIYLDRTCMSKEFVRIFGENNIWDLAKDLGAQCLFSNNWIEFEGHVTSLEMFKKVLRDAETVIYKKRTTSFPEKKKTAECAICFSTEIDDFYRLEVCGHSYCTSCINGLVRNAIEKKKTICECAHEECDKYVAPIDFKNVILGGEDRVKALDSIKLKKLCEQSILAAVLKSDGSIKACPTVDCNGILCASHSDDLDEPAECFSCKNDYCKRCLDKPHKKITCEENQRLRDDADHSIATYVKVNAKKVRHCPTCKAVIEKNAGCNHMQCPSCETHFCWRCDFHGKESQSVYAHMRAVHGSFMDENQLQQNQLNEVELGLNFGH